MMETEVDLSLSQATVEPTAQQAFQEGRFIQRTWWPSKYDFIIFNDRWADSLNNLSLGTITKFQISFSETIKSFVEIIPLLTGSYILYVPGGSSY
jgi:hypothetical protein